MKLIENFSIEKLDRYLEEPNKWEVYIACSSFEDRFCRSSSIFKVHEVKIDFSIIFNFKETCLKKEDNLRIVKSNLENTSKVIKIFDAESVFEPVKGIKKFLSYLESNNIDLRNKRIIIDISTFNKPYLFLLFKILIEKFDISEVYVVYTEPKNYNTLLTEGLNKVESIPGFTGSSINSKDALIVILGFEGNRSLEVFNAINPEFTYAINGFPSFQPGWDRRSLSENMRFLKESNAYEHILMAPASDPFETEKTIVKIVKEIREYNPDVNITISPLGTKIQALGALLYALKDKKVKIVYPIPSTHNKNRSEEFSSSWIYKIRLAAESE
jgi:hypothetical protein